jgi:penicillin-binding protein 2
MNRDESIVSDLACWAVAAVFVFGLAVLALRLKEVQVEDAADYSYANARQSVRRVQTDGVRGRIIDRNGVVLADNRKSVSIVCKSAFFQKRTWEATVANIETALSNVAAAVGSPSPLTRRDIRRHIDQTLAMPLVAWRDVGEKELARFCEHDRELPGFSVLETEERVYPQGRLASHLIGYVGRDRGESEAGDEKFNFYLPEMRGRSGLEIYYDSFLRGVPGERKVLVDARGFAIREWTVVESKRGPDLRISLDARIQRVAEEQLLGCKGACVVLDPRNGDVIAMASSPGYDPNEFVPRLSSKLYSSYAENPAKPLLNRASGGAYAPGSTFKPITALAGLKSGFPELVRHECTGVFVFGGMHLRCARRWGHGPLDMRHAIRESCNPYFCSLAADIGTNAVISAARAFGLGEKTGIDLGVDMAGTVPDGEWKMRMYGERWYPGDLPQMAIGQGMLLASPLQMARVAGAIGTGYLVAPRLKLDIPVRREPLPFSKKQLDVVREGMRMVVDGGTGRRGGERVAAAVSGKTGTAEIGRGETRRKNVWFIAFAPSEAPSAAVAMIIENGESGGGTAAPRVRNVLAAMFGETGTKEAAKR